MAKKGSPVWLLTYEDDGQIDVEVYEWNEESKQKGKAYEEVCEYGFSSKQEADDYIESLKETFTVVGISTLEEEEEKMTKQFASKTFQALSPTATVYEIGANELQARVEAYVSKSLSHPIQLELEYGEGESWCQVILTYDAKEYPQWVTNLLCSTFGIEEENQRSYDISDYVLDGALGLKILKCHWDPFYEHSIMIHTPTI